VAVEHGAEQEPRVRETDPAAPLARESARVVGPTGLTAQGERVAKDALDRAWRLLPSERVLWRGAPRLGVPRDLRYFIVPGLFFTLALVTALFAGLLYAVGIPAVRATAFTAFYMLVTGVASALAPRYLLDPCEYMLTDRHVIWKRGSYRRTMDRRGITYARIHWHRSVPGVGHLELVRAVPFGPLARKQRLMLHDVEAPDVLFARIREVQPTVFAGYADVKLTDRLDLGERVLWGGGPSGWRLGTAEALTALVGAAVLFAGGVYAYRTSAILVGLERAGLSVRTPTWMMLFAAIMISASLIVTVGSALFWQGLWGARQAGSHTEYLLTDTRLIIRRGLIELSIDRRRIVDVAEVPSTSGSSNLHLILDAPDARALDDNGALGMLAPPRATVPPVLYEVTDLELVRKLLSAKRHSDPPAPLAA